MKRLLVVCATLLLPMMALAGQEKLTVCHAEGNGTYHLLEVAERAYETHVRKHGDAGVGEPVPGMEGYVFDANCVPEEACMIACSEEADVEETACLSDNPGAFDDCSLRRDVFFTGCAILECPEFGSPVPLTPLSTTCYTPNLAAQLAKNRYLSFVRLFLGPDHGGVTCQDLRNQFEIVNDNIDRCRAACGFLPCPSKPLGPGAFPGTEACKVVQ